MGPLFRKPGTENTAAPETAGTSDEAARIRLEQAESDLKRAAALRDQKFISEEEYDNAETAVQLARAELAGDRVKASLIRVRAAEKALQRATAAWEQKVISTED